MIRVNLSFSEDEYKEIAVAAQREPTASFCKRIVLEYLREIDGAGLRRADATHGDSAPTRATDKAPSAEMRTAPTPFERKSAKPLWKGRKGRLL